MNRFILASASPRRKLLLEKEGYQFDIIPSHVDESKFSENGITPARLTMILARAKAMEVALKNPGRLVLGCDTVVDYRGMIVGKPRDAEDAERITRMLFSGPHDVITGICLVKIDEDVEITEAVTTTVYPVKLTEDQIKRHIDSGGWKGKAGAYGIQETGDEFVERIEGSFTNVIGLPMERTSELLNHYLK